MEFKPKQVITKGENITSSILENPVKWQWQNVTNTEANKLLSQHMNWVIRKLEKEMIRLLSITAREKVLIIFRLKKEVETVDGRGSRRH